MQTNPIAATAMTHKAAEAQKHYCNTKKCPMFAPMDGYCYRCGSNIYRKYTPEWAGKTLITSCPYCNASFTD